MDMMYGGTGVNLTGLLTWLLVFLVKILTIVLVFAVVMGIVIWIRNNLFVNKSGSTNSSAGDPVLKTIAGITLGILGIVTIFALLGGLTPGGQMGAGYGGYNPTFSISSLLQLLLKVFTFVFVLAIIMAAVTYVKTQYDQGNLKFLNFTQQNQNQNQSGNSNPESDPNPNNPANS